MSKKLYIIAGEASGDVIGAEILKYIPDTVQVYGIGGPLMAQQGLKSLFEYGDLSVMGLVDIVRSYNTLKNRIKDTVAHIQDTQPHMILSIDSQGFCKKVSHILRTSKYDFSYHHIHVVAPTVWAWRAGRAKKIGRYFDTVLCLYPFEPSYFKTINAHFVGHPSVDILSHVPDIPLENNSIAVLVGSRVWEIKRCGDIYAKVVQKLYENRQCKIYVPVLPAHKELVQDIFRKYTFSYEIVPPSDKNTVLKSVSVALTTSGTMTLELGILNTPMVVGYKMEYLFYQIVKRLYTKKYVALPNIILGDKQIVPEFIQNNMTVDTLYNAVCTVMDTAGETQRLSLSALKQLVHPPYDTFGNSVYQYIKQYM